MDNQPPGVLVVVDRDPRVVASAKVRLGRAEQDEHGLPVEVEHLGMIGRDAGSVSQGRLSGTPPDPAGRSSATSQPCAELVDPPFPGAPRQFGFRMRGEERPAGRRGPLLTHPQHRRERRRTAADRTEPQPPGEMSSGGRSPAARLPTWSWFCRHTTNRCPASPRGRPGDRACARGTSSRSRRGRTPGSAPWPAPTATRSRRSSPAAPRSAARAARGARRRPTERPARTRRPRSRCDHHRVVQVGLGDQRQRPAETGRDRASTSRDSSASRCGPDAVLAARAPRPGAARRRGTRRSHISALSRMYSRTGPDSPSRLTRSPQVLRPVLRYGPKRGR